MIKKRERRPDDRPDEILDAAIAVFTAKGFAAARMDDIAKAAHLSKGALYLYFKSKDQLFEALVRRFSRNFASAAIGAAQNMAALDPAEAIRAMFRAILAMAKGEQSSAVPRLVFAEAPRFPHMAELYRTMVLDAGYSAMSALLDSGKARGLFRDIPAAAAIRAIIGPMLAHMMLTHVFKVNDTDAMDTDTLADAVADIVLGGLIAPKRESAT